MSELYTHFAIVICYNIYMKISKKTDIAIRVLLYLRNNHYVSPNFVSAHLISSELDVSYNNIRKIFSTLSELGFTESRLGQNGGVSLSRDYQQISIMKLLIVFEEFDVNDSRINCATCNIKTSCSFDNLTSQALLNFFMTYKDIYLDNI